MTTARRSSPASRRARAARTSTACPVFDTRRRGGAPSAAPTPRWCSCRRASPPTRSTRPPTRASSTIVCITEGIPAHDMLRIYNYMRPRGVTLLGPELPRRALAGRRQRRHHPGAGVRRGPRRPGLALGHADVPDRQGAGRPRARQLDDRRHRRRPDRRQLVHRRAASVRGRRRDRPGGDGRRDRRRRGGEGGRVHRRAHDARRSSPTSRASRRRPARRWATPARSSPARRARPPAKKEALEARGMPRRLEPHRGRAAGRRRRCARANVGDGPDPLHPRRPVGRPAAGRRPARGRCRRRFASDAAGALAYAPGGYCAAARVDRRAPRCRARPGAAGQRLAAGRRVPGRAPVRGRGGAARGRGSDLRPHA